MDVVRSAPMALNDKQKMFLEWLTTPKAKRDIKTQKEFASYLGVDAATLSRWKNDDEEFLSEWNKLYLKEISNPATKRAIMKTLYETATDSDDPKHVQAAKTFFEIEGSMKPKQVEVSVSRPASDLSDEEIDKLLAGHAQQEKDIRSTGTGDVVPFRRNADD